MKGSKIFNFKNHFISNIFQWIRSSLHLWNRVIEGKMEWKYLVGKKLFSLGTCSGRLEVYKFWKPSLIGDWYKWLEKIVLKSFVINYWRFLQVRSRSKFYSWTFSAISASPFLRKTLKLGKFSMPVLIRH